MVFFTTLQLKGALSIVRGLFYVQTYNKNDVITSFIHLHLKREEIMTLTTI